MDQDYSIVSLVKCPACGSEKLAPARMPHHWIGEELFRPLKGRIGLNRCLCCGLVFCNPRPNQKILALFFQADDYFPHSFQDNNYWAKKQVSLSLRILEEYVGSPNGKKLLDFGCGGGYFLWRAGQAGWDATGFDIGRRAIDSCRARSLKVADRFEELPKNKFDVIALLQVLEQVFDLDGLLSELKQLLSNGGKILITVPNTDSLRAILSNPVLSRMSDFGERYGSFPIHLSYFNIASLRALLERHGLSIDLVSTYGYGISIGQLMRNGPAQDMQGRKAFLRRSTGPAGFFKDIVKGSGLFKKISNRFFSMGLGDNILMMAGLKNR